MGTRISRPVAGQPAAVRSAWLEPVRTKLPAVGPLVDSSLDRAKHLWYHLPFVHQQREGTVRQHGIGIRAYDRGLGGTVQAEPFPAVPPAGGRLAARAGADDQDGGVVGQQVTEQRIDKARQVLRHGRDSCSALSTPATDGLAQHVPSV